MAAERRVNGLRIVETERDEYKARLDEITNVLRSVGVGK